MTAELAVALPAVVLVLVAVLVIAAAGIVQLRVTDAARAGARAAAAGETDARAAEIAQRTAGDAVSVSVHRADPWVTVTVAAPVAGGWFGGRGLAASATSTAWLESAVVVGGTQ
ncbi:TadE family type IV pilus minor pilin [Sanguibacter antarcticus]|uniref:TadE family type IV pilus minor pilin n=1 Tax=Sanguibacter antarcticus TaxID=372484 RepID=UPI001FEAD971|nr:TadE family type IV pilus minor pilin [Sanguibacter antarcticus]